MAFGATAVTSSDKSERCETPTQLVGSLSPRESGQRVDAVIAELALRSEGIEESVGTHCDQRLPYERDDRLSPAEAHCTESRALIDVVSRQTGQLKREERRTMQ